MKRWQRELRLGERVSRQWHKNHEIRLNTLLIQQILSEPKQFQQMKKEDLRALTPLIYSHVTPYGTFRLDLSERMRIEEEQSAS